MSTRGRSDWGPSSPLALWSRGPTFCGSPRRSWATTARVRPAGPGERWRGCAEWCGARSGGQVPEPGHPCGVAFLRPLLPGEVRKHPGGDEECGAGERPEGASWGPVVDLCWTWGALLGPSGPWQNLDGARLRRQQEEGAPPGDWYPVLGHTESVAGRSWSGPCWARREPPTCACARSRPGWPAGTSWTDSGTCEAGRSGESLEVRRLRARLLVLP
ncbi:hypothetical protein NDU88_007206 [Pleurodeles waltl]|uniref:Uncharacterized protein n=1 Tax=Pleurodeles waltl TaxID=8319 RepID=A0AAV7UNQ3_PLEWA|nr:hypothetical protein NDU88_007206 [Pleurodeles waltl]